MYIAKTLQEFKHFNSFIVLRKFNVMLCISLGWWKRRLRQCVLNLKTCLTVKEFFL